MEITKQIMHFLKTKQTDKQNKNRFILKLLVSRKREWVKKVKENTVNKIVITLHSYK